MIRTSEAGNRLCDCGCGGELSDAAVAKGWRYLRGHKARGPQFVHKEIHRRAPRTGPGAEANLSIITTFARSQRDLLAGQLATARAAATEASRLECEVEIWSTVLAELEKLGGAA